jgi:lipoprotein-releasing system permease protein
VRPFVVQGIYDTGFKEYDDVIVLVDLRHLARVNDWEVGDATGVAVELEHVNRVKEMRGQIQAALLSAGLDYDIKTLGDAAPQIFDWLKLINMNVWVILILIVLVAGFNMVSGLLILMLDKTNLIGLMKAFGYRNISLRRLFLYISTGLIVRGMMWGNLLAFALAGLQYRFHVIKLDPASYYMNTVPVHFDLVAGLLLNIGVILVTVLMLIVPTMLISRIDPIKSIKFD